MIDDCKEIYERAVFLIFIWIILFGMGIGIGRCTKDNTTPPVEEIIKADSIVKINDSIKIKVEHLDSIKDAKIIEVQALDNDSTLKLFYELISK